MSNRKVRTILKLSAWIIVAAGMLVLLISAMGKRDEQRCVGIEVELKGRGQSLFIERKDILDVLTANGGRPIKGKPIASIDIKLLETQLEKNVWINNAELFFDKDAVLHVIVQENIPVARLFTSNGVSGYIDSAGNRLPLSDKFSARLPVFTGFPTDKSHLTGKDSVLMERVKDITRFLQANPFWNAQIAQVHITPERMFELYPLVGDHVIELGDGLDLENRFKRLKIFYEQVMKETGVQSWKRLKIQYERQVVAEKKTGNN